MIVWHQGGPWSQVLTHKADYCITWNVTGSHVAIDCQFNYRKMATSRFILLISPECCIPFLNPDIPAMIKVFIPRGQWVCISFWAFWHTSGFHGEVTFAHSQLQTVRNSTCNICIFHRQKANNWAACKCSCISCTSGLHRRKHACKAENRSRKQGTYWAGPVTHLLAQSATSWELEVS